MNAFLGIDVGSLTAEAVIVSGGRSIASAIRPVRPDPRDSAREVVDAALDSAALARGAIRGAVATGYGRERLVDERVVLR